MSGQLRRSLKGVLVTFAGCAGPSPEVAGGVPVAEDVKQATVVAAPTVVGAPKVAGEGVGNVVLTDPAWFSPTLYAGATVTRRGRTQADEQGRFTAQLLFSLAEGATLADCTEPLERTFAELVPELVREEKEGRVTLKGEAKEGYEVICVCGEAKGKMTAFVSYRGQASSRLPPGK